MTAACVSVMPHPRLRDLSDYLSPVAVKELRQIVRSGFVSTAFLTLLGIELLVMAVFLMQTGRLTTTTAGIGRGAELFTYLHAILAILAIAFVPAYTGVRMALERSATDVDLLYVTTMQPWSILLGKLAAALVLTAMLFAACMPFMVLTYLLRGVDIPTIFSVLLATFVTVTWAVAVVLLAGCLRVPTAVRIVIAAVLIGGLIAAAAINIDVTRSAVRHGEADGIATGMFWMETALALLGNIQCIALVLLLAAAALAASTTDRMRPVRTVMTVAWAVTIVPALAGAALGSSVTPVVKWSIWQVVCVSVVLLAAISERANYTRRILAKVPERPLRRFGAFLLSTGWAGGVCWCAISLVATCAILTGACAIWVNDFEFALGIIAAIGCGAAHLYAAALMAQAAIGPGRVGRFRQPSMAWLLGLAFYGISCIPIGIFLAMIGLSTASVTGAAITYAVLTLGPASLLTLGATGRIRQQLRLFRRIDPGQPPPMPQNLVSALPAMPEPPTGPGGALATEPRR